MMFSTITTAPSTTMPKSSAPSESRFAGNALQLEAGGGEQQRERDGQRDDKGSAHVAQEHEQHDRDQDDSLGQVVHDGVRGEMHQVAAVEKRDDGDARRKQARMPVRSVELLYFLVDRFERGVAFGAFLQQDDALDDVVVVENVAVQFVNRLADPPQADFRALRHHGDVRDANRRAALGGDDGLLNIAAPFSPGRRRAR